MHLSDYGRRKRVSIGANWLPMQSALTARQIAVLAVRSLHAELCLYPKPGLVSLRDNGSHSDMHPALFMRSLFSLRHYFKHMARLGMRVAAFTELKQAGMLAEQQMLRATAQVNTHRGAIFALGMLCAAIGACVAQSRALAAAEVRRVLQQNWGSALQLHAAVVAVVADSHGQAAAQRYAVSGAREEAALGFPSVFEIALPLLQHRLAQGGSAQQARVDCLFSLIAGLSDTNLYHRGGAAGAAYARAAAAEFLAAGGSAQPAWFEQAQTCHRQFVARRLSPGGAADLLAACCLLQQLEQFSAGALDG
ncbi:MULTISPECIES: triphosphoribosyl-dephospho-CoA synthase MdcB [unclassified Undibacterium]|uniref:triphosphoribosyl-dephospho-CoA synthase MdcB n=1 Tax=unclassified Undibacterium TaxID=2630295 RepID=UPI002AC8E58A|nr:MULTISPECIES: triphosphoribosyl-dephospho-CoA synthase MdcB [unclassified Undibacterium]MEB0137457.1 triphosphoribosyl-dephospho-CoA synthase MdcB [Undibacterium sp. CCC2.1]MEB0170878.1 triphosphoribosyl-dephospho-CoA synthase MdcB [Undibacterium sp. CCC1.1]MEB0174830.1 triphosphoribosyl-dephospho-CoA synthase MdcB [Undibacterium sp. CCC3.4]MEB0214166.1 triphosphoribosyl-dephospho-CoA synthase MdcB [Undibacterium sp. 5I2]WPX44478.1 triphosphoribosyl-dephospho-CoA synthase MdcB [Undibacteriu